MICPLSIVIALKINKQSSTSQRDNINGKLTVPLPQLSKKLLNLPSRSPSLIHRSPNGGYVSLLRRAISTLGDGDSSAVRFNSLQRPDRGHLGTSQRHDHQFRSMRNNGSAKNVIDCITPGIVPGQDKNNNRSYSGNNCRLPPATVVTESTKNEIKRDGKDVVTTTFPKPAPRTRVPSAAAAPPSLAQRDNYANLQQLLNGNNNIDKKVRCM